MIYGPCMCGALDCRSCSPESFRKVSCECCGENAVAIDTDDWSMAELNGEEHLFCHDCADQAEEIICAGCGEKTIRFFADNWEYLEGDAFCPDCITELEHAAKWE